jgi:23S rRNA (uracil1939-C5)-methyltransferase
MSSSQAELDLAVPLVIDRLGDRGEGQAKGPYGPVFVPYALPGEEIIAEVDGERGHLAEIVIPSADRIAAICPFFGLCGGCAVQTLALEPYRAWKRALLIEAMRHAKLPLEVAGEVIDAHGEGRRRATFHARLTARHDRMQVGFMHARTHDLIEIDRCPILSPSLHGAVAAAQDIANTLVRLEKPLDIVVTATSSGLDIDVRGSGALDNPTRQALIDVAERQDIARLSNHGVIVIERRPPQLLLGSAGVIPPPGAFLQATVAGEEALAARAIEALHGSRRIADLFAGLGTFALRLATQAEVHAFDFDEPALIALQKASNAAADVRPVAVFKRDLFRRPLSLADLKPYDGLIFDPPRSGAEAQAAIIAKSEIPTVVAVSCNVQSFARDAKLLCAGGYRLERVDPIDQFRFSAHLEMIGIFRRDAKKPARRRKLLG